MYRTLDRTNDKSGSRVEIYDNAGAQGMFRSLDVVKHAGKERCTKVLVPLLVQIISPYSILRQTQVS